MCMDEEIKKLIEENLALTKEIHQILKKVHRHFIWQRVIGFIYLLLIVGPVILAVIYLPPIIGPMIQQYQDLLGGMSAQPSQPSGEINLKNLEQWGGLLQELQKSGGSTAPR